MLTSDEYSDMARYALERIPGEAVDKALLEALTKTQGKVQVGIVNSLGERGYRPAAPEIAKMVGSSDQQVSGAAISALGKIGGPDALAALNKALQSAPEAQKMAVYDALLKIADKMAAAGDKLGASKIYVSMNKDGVPSMVRTAAMRGIAGGRGGNK
jgi:HEAT repeat protein